MSFSDNLLKLRKSKGLSQENLADKLDLSRQAVSKWELGTSKPDIDNVQKISNFFNVSVDDLIGNETIKTETTPINIKEDTKKDKILKLTTVVIVAAVILFIIIVVYKFIMLFRITKVGESYKELENYHYVIYGYSENDMEEKEEYWFKEGTSKMVKTVYENHAKQGEKTIYIDYNNKSGWQLDGISGKKANINVEEYLLFNENFDKGAQLYSKFPDIIKEESLTSIIRKCIFDKKVSIKNNDSNIFISLNNSYVNLEKNTLLPIVFYYEDKEKENFKIKQYNIELNTVESIKI